MLFQQEWEKRPPVMISDVHKVFDQDLWNLESFKKDL